MVDDRRFRLPGGCQFFTVSTADRARGLLVERITDLREAFREVRARHPFELGAIVVVPDHLHRIWSLPDGDDDFSTPWRRIKSAFSHRVPPGERRSASRLAKGERGVWQRRFWEHALRDEAHCRQPVDYIHYDPFKHGHVPHMRDWPYSSFHRFVQRK